MYNSEDLNMVFVVGFVLGVLSLAVILWAINHVRFI